MFFLENEFACLFHRIWRVSKRFFERVHFKKTDGSNSGRGFLNSLTAALMASKNPIVFPYCLVVKKITMYSASVEIKL